MKARLPRSPWLAAPLALAACSPATPEPDRTLVPWPDAPAVLAADAALLDAALGAAPPSELPAAPPGAPDIVVVVLDTVRADHLGLYGYERATSPALDRWATGARVYDRFTADAPWTLPSHASLFTGRWPTAHGAHGEHIGGRLRFAAPLPPGTDTVARRLRAAGYQTMGIAANQAYLDARWGVSQGFDVWLCEQLGEDSRPAPYPTADRITTLALRALEAPATGPRLLFLNYLDAHAPWVPREGYVRDREALDRSVGPYGRPEWRKASDAVLTGRGVPPSTLAAWTEAYDAELRFLDAQVGRLLDGLAARGVGPEDWVFVLADHGEYLGEHDLLQHGRDVYEPVLHVPLLVRGPGVEAGRDATPLQHHDVATRILAAAGLPPLEGSTPTQDVVVSEQHYARWADIQSQRYGHRFTRIRRAFRQGDLKLLVGSDGTEELYDLAADPGELHPLDDPQLRARLRIAARRWTDATPVAPVAPPPADDAATTEKLRALGYEE